MLMARIMRILRSKILVTGISSLFILYLSVHYLWYSEHAQDYVGGQLGMIRRPQEFKWASDEIANETNKVVTSCRNSVQGKLLLADDQGYVCQRVDLFSTGCCNNDRKNTERYSCETCNIHGCCAIYEHCVSCCLHPDKKGLLKRVLGLPVNQSPLYASVSDHFELCLVKCRTSSQSVQHETHYRDPRAKHCYGEGPPPIVNTDV